MMFNGMCSPKVFHYRQYLELGEVQSRSANQEDRRDKTKPVIVSGHLDDIYKIYHSSRLLGMTKLSDANNAGTKHAKDCTLILTEGDSAKALAVAGLSVVGRDNFGVFPLRGKLLNVREAKHEQIMKNEEIQNIKKIMGLQHNKDYSNVTSLRYGRLMIMADQVGYASTHDICSGDSKYPYRITMVLISKALSLTFWSISTHPS